jgi:mannose/fructose/N-acetylgalactosamine-specific phosphotransferase system component IIB
MSISVIRLDDRLVHGQVVVGWGNALGIERIVLVDDSIAATEWEQELYAMGVPDSMHLEFSSVAAARERINEWTVSHDKVILLVSTVPDLIRLCHETPLVNRVNIGGVHRAEGRTERLPYVFLSEEEYEQLEELASHSIEVTAQDLPSVRPVPLSELAS